MDYTGMKDQVQREAIERAPQTNAHRKKTGRAQRNRGIYTRNALHQLPDFWKALALHRIAGMLRPGGVLRLRDLIYDFGPGEADRVFRGWLEHASADPAEGYTGADYAEHIRTEFSTFRWLLEPMLAEAGFEIVRADFEGSLYGAYTCIKSGG
jgi:hypothetical protein